MNPQAWITVAALVLVFGLLAFTRIAAELVMLGVLTLLLTVGVLPADEALAGFANEGVIAIAVLYVVAAGLRGTGAIELLVGGLLGSPRSVTAAQARLLVTVTLLSAFIYDTPLVAMLLPVVNDWARKNNIPASKVMIPLSYAALLGGVCTLIGTSTNLIVNGLLVSQTNLPALRLFDQSWVGVPCALVGIAYLLVCSRWLLPGHGPAISEWDDARQYTVEMVVDPDGPLVGRTIEEAQLRHLPGLYLIEVERADEFLPAVAPTERLRSNDRLVFAGIVESVVDLQRIRGLKPATTQVYKLDSPRSQRCLIEAVVSNTCPILGKTIRAGRFRTTYNAAVIAVARNGERLCQKIGDIVLQAGDTLLLEAHPLFADQQRNTRDFFLVSRVEDSTPPHHERAWIALAVLLGMVVAVGVGWLSVLNAALLAAGLLLLARCCSVPDARRSIDARVLVVIAASFGIGRAMHRTGAADAIAQTLIGLAGTNPWAALAAVFIVTMLFTELISHHASVVLVFPIARATALSLGVSFLPFAVALMIAASCGFSMPIGCQTNLMVSGPGGYRFADYLRIGAPLNLLIGIVTVLLAPLVWKF
jgi:di/tricarboxylate transporter